MNMEKLSVPIAIIIAGGLIAGALYYSNMKVNGEPLKVTEKVNQDAVSMRPVTAEDHILGNPNADLVMVEYSDLECPYCKQFHITMKKIMDIYGKDGRVAWVYRHFPIESLHSKAPKEAEATECANELGGPEKFWQFTNLVYETTNSNDSLDPKELPKMAKTVGLDVTAFNECLSSGKYTAKVKADYDDAIKAGGQGTPTSFIIAKDGTKTSIEGAQPFEAVKATIDALLQS
jgi:protein-disulfide isomerase